MKVIFAGTPEFSCPSLSALAEEFEVCAVLTACDLPKGRGRKLTPSPVADLAESFDIPTLKFSTIGKEARETVTAMTPDLLIAVAYGRIFGPRFLATFGLGGINVHPSLLPKYRGPAPIPAAILAGESETGVTVQKIALEMDAGDVLMQETIQLRGDETTGSLTERCSHIGATLLVQTVRSMENDTTAPERQIESDATYCTLIEKDAGRIDWTLPAKQIDRMIRGYSPWPTAFTTLRGQRLSILSATVLEKSDESKKAEDHDAGPGVVTDIDKQRGILVQTGSGSLAVDYLQLQSKKPNRFRDFLNGQPGGSKAFAGTMLGGEV
jgi:methionyl-tRNA formyltransferase